MYQLNEGTIDLPNEWNDQSINVISSVGGNAPGLTFTITRDDMPWGMGFVEYVDGEIEKAKEALMEFDVSSKSVISVAGVEAVEIECTWKAKQGPMHQIITTVNAPAAALVLTASQPGAMSENQKTEVRRMVASLNLNKSASVA